MSCPTAQADGYRYVYDASTNTIVKVRSGTHESRPADTQPVYAYAFAPACPGSTPTNAVMCQRATVACADPEAMMMDVWRMELAPDPTEWIYQDAECIRVSDRVDVTRMKAKIHEDITDYLPSPTPRVQPGGSTQLVQLPTLVSVADPGPQGFDVTQPVPGHATVSSTYTWTFDDGTVLVGAGRPYDPADDPVARPDHYLSHTYHRTTPSGWVELTTTWNATFTVAGGPTFSLDPVTMGPTRVGYAVKQARAVLVAH